MNFREPVAWFADAIMWQADKLTLAVALLEIWHSKVAQDNKRMDLSLQRSDLASSVKKGLASRWEENQLQANNKKLCNRAAAVTDESLSNQVTSFISIAQNWAFLLKLVFPHQLPTIPPPQLGFSCLHITGEESTRARTRMILVSHSGSKSFWHFSFISHCHGLFSGKCNSKIWTLHTEWTTTLGHDIPLALSCNCSDWLLHPKSEITCRDAACLSSTCPFTHIS